MWDSPPKSYIFHVKSWSKISLEEEVPKADKLQLMELQQSSAYQISWIIEKAKKK